MKNKYYLAYGSNLNLGQMAHRCPEAQVVGSSEVPGYRLLFRGRPGNAHATIEPWEGGTVPVLLWEITPQDELALDQYEGYPSYYTKETLEVTLGGEQVEAMVYLMAPGFAYNEPAPTYLDCIREGYRSADFDQAVLDRALEDSRQGMEETLLVLAKRLLQKQREFEVEYAHNSTALAGNSLTLEQVRAILDAIDPPRQLLSESENRSPGKEESPQQTM